jgi:hypothetical protein
MVGAAADAESAMARMGLLASSRCSHEHQGEHVRKKALGCMDTSWCPLLRTTSAK